MNIKHTLKVAALALLPLGGVAGSFLFTSCEDMFTTENKHVTTDLTPQDTVYQMLGIVNAMQKIVDQTILMGEIRADLVDINEHTPMYIKELSDNNVGVDNIYNNPSDYYGIINSCNIYLAHVDTALKTHGNYYYEKEIVASKCFRAWTYLELAKQYGSVPFILDPVLTANAAEEIVTSTTNRKDLIGICDYFIKDLLPHASTDRNNELIPGYVSSKFFIPVRLMLAELYLWRGSFTQSQSDFVEAVRFYHDYLAFPNEEVWEQPMMFGYWSTTDYRATSSGSSSGREITQIQLDTIAYYGGNYSDLRSVFCAQYSNNYFAAVNPSQHLRQISSSQAYCNTVHNSTTDIDTIVGHPQLEELASLESPQLYVGDLRLTQGYSNFSVSDMYHAEYSKERQYLAKYTGGSRRRLGNDERLSAVTLYRPATVYLHFAEALNRAGFPETAFAILKYGISETILKDSTKVSTDEYTRLSAIASVGFASNAADWDQERFTTFDRISATDDEELLLNLFGSSRLQLPIHAYGSGYSWCNPAFYLPTDSTGIVEVPVDTFTVDNLLTEADTLAHEALLAKIEAARKINVEWLATETVRSQRIAALDKIILTEAALELAYEGTRFYDLMRYAKFNNNPALLAEQVARRKGKDEVDAALLSKLSAESGWYLPLRSR